MTSRVKADTRGRGTSEPADDNGETQGASDDAVNDDAAQAVVGVEKSSRGTSRAAKVEVAKVEVAKSAAATTASLPATVAEAVRSLLARPLASYHLILTLGFLLTAFGLVMVLSASSVEGYSKDGSAYGLFSTQVIFAFLGFFVFYVTLRVPVRFLRRAAAPLMIVTTILLALVLVPGLGTLSQGARRWFVVYGLSVQPSELVKVALCVWGAHLLASRRQENASLRELLVPLVPVGMLICLLIILEPNLSTTITIAIIIGALLWFAGLPVKVFLTFAVSAIGIAVMLALVEGYRSQRVMSFLNNIDDPQGAGYQERQATYALANGGVFGVGLGQSRAKWNYLPNAHNDFIFAIIGEELGLLGGLLVVFLFVVLAYVGFRIAHRSTDPFLRLMAATITVLIIAQALINIGYVIGLLPVTGIQLPLLSAGGTSTLTVLAMLGLLANAARHEPEAVAALTTGRPSRVSRLLRLPTPVAYRKTRAETLRDRMDQRRGHKPPSAGRGGMLGRRRTPPPPAGRGRRRGQPPPPNRARRGADQQAEPRRGFTPPWRRGADPEPARGPRQPAATNRGRVDYRNGHSGHGTRYATAASARWVPPRSGSARGSGNPGAAARRAARPDGAGAGRFGGSGATYRPSARTR
ncbi:putative lipid II flippase FtsW [Gordonia sp. ABSL49_1]|uniref:putative lipid II flippase FtsW n=2 Tax=unclassified Gordonia (in: high G+C Gram-positive bacteria) TaxID=2657482 RepID=UPI001F104361|nr:putative lipid II flippase FtsW [Gordonia sp. ABSL49_1]MCH5641585.1 putative lipid II flippase FtsW [Gordonia sp. ABSL49_1]